MTFLPHDKKTLAIIAGFANNLNKNCSHLQNPMISSTQQAPQAETDKPSETGRVRLQDLLQQQREIEIDHGGKIYRLRLTQANKLILTA